MDGKKCSSLGFYQPFCANRASGYQEEKWHWSYAPLSKKYLDEYIKTVSYEDIHGFQGSVAAKELNTIVNWVLAVNPELKEKLYTVNKKAALLLQNGFLAGGSF